jgi:hypothetical protein
MNIKRFTILLTLLLATVHSYTQKQANYWYFGENAGISFAMGVPVALTNGALNTGEGCSSISNTSGNLEFYTDGRFVYNRNHQQMPGGSGLFGHSSSTQSGIIVPKPASTTQYYIFTVDAWDNDLANGLCYTRVDMTLDGGLGGVVTSEKNISLIPYTCEKVTAVGHSNGLSVWVITHQWGSDAFYAFEVTTSGVNTTPVISHAGPPLIGDMQASKGYIKVSPSGETIAMANNTAFNVGIFNFNNATGVVTHLVTDYNYINPGGSDPGGPYGVEFSANSNLLYIGEWKANRRIHQYNLSSGDPTTILDSRVIVATVGQNSDPIGAIQLGPDNRMYIARRNSSYLSRINSPNVIGIGCGFVDNALNLSGRQCTYGLPPFIQSFFFLTADYYWDTPSCDGTPVQFYTSASDTPDSVLWNFGDPASGPENTSTLLNPTHLYPGPGTYWVTLTVHLYGVAKNVFHIVVVSVPPVAYIGNDTTVCASEPFYLDAGSGYNAYLWQNGETTQTIEATTSGLYWCQVTGDGGCFDTDSLNLVINPLPIVSAGPDITIPSGVSTILEGAVSGGSGSFTFQWEPADKLVNPNVLQPETIILSFTTLFTLTVTDDQGGCFDSDQAIVTISGGVLGCNPIADPASICFGDQTQLEALASGGTGNYTYSWTSSPPGFNSEIHNPVVAPLLTTTYNLTVSDEFSSVNGNVTVTVHPLPVPNAGTDKTIPNGTSTMLTGSASAGSGNYIYQWEPAYKLVNPGSPQPTTVNLSETTLFYLTVIDAQTGCISDQPDDVIVYITGNALNVNPTAQPDTICSGASVQLYSLAGGGSGIYEYSWTSVPPGFTSTVANPVVNPLVSTVYSVYLSDGYAQVSGSISVAVNPSPVVDLGPDATICVFDTLTLDAGNPGANYIWSNGSTERVIRVATTGIGFDFKTISVTVSTPEGCVVTDQRSIVFDFAACTGIDETLPENGFQIYPNPGDGLIHIQNKTGITNCQLSITDIYGREVLKNQELVFSDQESTFKLNLDSLAPGLYLVKISENGRHLASMKYLLK